MQELKDQIKQSNQESESQKHTLERLTKKNQILTKIAKRSESNGPATTATANQFKNSPPQAKKFIKIKKIQIDPKEKAAEYELLTKMKEKISLLDRKLSKSKNLSS